MSSIYPHCGKFLYDLDVALSLQTSDKYDVIPKEARHELLPSRALAGQSRGLPYPAGDADHEDFWRRVVAALIDGGFWGFLLLLSAIFTGVPRHGILSVVLCCVVVLCYFTVMENSSTQATLGQMAMGITGCDEEGQPISLARAWAHIVKCASVPALVFGFIATHVLARTPLLNR